MSRTDSSPRMSHTEENRPSQDRVVTRTLVLQNRLGLHARPSALIIKTLQNFQCNIKVECNGETANARSILGLLSLAAGYGAKLTFSASGLEAEMAIEALTRLFETHFEEAY